MQIINALQLKTWGIKAPAIKALRSSLINKPWSLKASVIALALLSSAPSYTCGPEYDSLGIDMISNLGFDPRAPSNSDVNFLWRELVSAPYYQEERTVIRREPNEDEKIAAFTAHLNSAFVAAGRGLRIPIGIEAFRVNKNPDITMVSVEYPRDNYSWGSCASNNRTAFLIFVEAAIADKAVSDTEVMELISLRSTLRDICFNDEQLATFIASLTAATNTYKRYLLAISYFYRNDYEKALVEFTHISQASHALSELSLYLIGRSYLRGNQPENDSVNFFESEAQKTQAREGNLKAVTAFENYLTAYPTGTYANSARGLIRRAQWLAGNHDDFSKRLQEHTDTKMQRILANDSWTPEEYDEMSILLGEFQRFVANDANNMHPLEMIVKQVNMEDATRSNKHKALAELKTFLATYTEFKNGNYAKVIQQLTNNHQFKTPNFLLLVRALEVSGEWQKAVDLWRDARLAEEAYGLKYDAGNEMAKILVAQGGIEKLLRDTDFTLPADSYLGDTNRIIANYLSSLCGERTQLKWLSDASIPLNNRQIILADVATRHLYSENFTALNEVFSLYADDVLSGFSGIRTAVRQVTEQKQLGKAYMNIGYFMQTRITPRGHLPAALRQLPDEDGNEVHLPDCQHTILHNDSGAAGPYYYYNLALTHFNDEKNTDEAKTLHFITQCFKTGGEYDAACLWGHRNTEKSRHARDYSMSSEQAFKRLHKKYAGTTWAEKTPYYY